ncbi:MAG: hypothetical protein MJE63_21950 [Proteobacteria bacterium]|nr:hypothetical protein [Pseudomonadota bacterium]
MKAKAMNLLVKQKQSDEWHIHLNTLKAEHPRKSSLMKFLRLFDTSPIIKRN